jgi:hypothetical protein
MIKNLQFEDGKGSVIFGRLGGLSGNGEIPAG